MAREEVIGAWRATAHAIEDLRKVGIRDHLAVEDHTLSLAADGSCSFRSITGVPFDGSADYRIYESGCRWRLDDIDHQAVLFDLTSQSQFQYHLYFWEEDGRLLLWQHIDDPDSWRYIEFEKIRR